MNASIRALAMDLLRSKAAIVFTVLTALGASFVAESAFAVDLQVAETVLLYQRRSGGWPKNYDRKQKLTDAQRQHVLKERSRNDATVDNGATHTEIRVLAEAYAKTRDVRFKEAALRGIRYLLDGQYKNGGWPQRFPGPTGYQRYITFNDNAMVGILNLLKEVADGKVEYAFVSQDVRQECVQAVQHGIECILKCQIEVAGKPTAWCAQHDHVTLKPRKARSYELASLSGAESVGIVRFLMGIENPDDAVIRAIEGAVNWFERSKLEGIKLVRKEDASKPKGFDYVVVEDPDAPPLWARFYDIKTNQPIFCSRDGVPRRTLAEISYERRTGYSWLGPYARELLDKDLPDWRRRLVVLCSSLCHTSYGNQEERRQITVTKPYLVIPIENGAEACPVTISLGDERLACVTIELARDKVDFWTFLDLKDHTGSTVTLSAKNPSKGFHAIRSSDTIPGADALYHEKYRPQFHFSSKRGRINDANGLVYYKGEYQLFYQHNPYGLRWSNMTWGHAVSKDLIHWEELPSAIHPDTLGNIHSGSAVVDWNNTSGLQKGSEKVLAAFYTAAGGMNLPDIAGDGRNLASIFHWSRDKLCTQAMAYSTDAGRTWTKYGNNPIVKHMEGRNRDPKVFWHESSRQWIMALYLAGKKYALMGSKDLLTWKRLSTLTMPGAIECPDLFELPVKGTEDETRWVFWGGNGKYLVGDFDGKTFVPETKPLSSEWGANCYGGQSWSDIPESDGRRLWIGWMKRGWGSKKEWYPGMAFNQQLTIAREFSLHQTPEGPRLHIRPVREIANIRGERFTKQDITLRPGVNPLAESGGELLEIDARLNLGGASRIQLGLGSVALEYDVQNRKLSCLGKSAPLSPMDDRTLDLHVLVDRTSVEVFANDGLVVMSFCVTPEQLEGGLSLKAEGGDAYISEVNVYRLNSIWPKKVR